MTIYKDPKILSLTSKAMLAQSGRHKSVAEDVPGEES